MPFYIFHQNSFHTNSLYKQNRHIKLHREFVFSEFSTFFPFPISTLNSVLHYVTIPHHSPSICDNSSFDSFYDFDGWKIFEKMFCLQHMDFLCCRLRSWLWGGTPQVTLPYQISVYMIHKWFNVVGTNLDFSVIMIPAMSVVTINDEKTKGEHIA